VLVARIAVFVVGLVVAVGTGASAVRTFVVPRGIPVALSRTVFLAVRWAFTKTAPTSKGYLAMDRRMAFYAPVSLLVLPAVWLTLLLLAFAAMFWGLRAGTDAWTAIAESGSSLVTLGSAPVLGRPATLLSFVEAATGITMLALLITYLPTIYSAFTRREVLVSLLEVRGGVPPWAVTMLIRYQIIGLLNRSDELFERAEEWFADIEESHTSLSALPFFRSPQPEHSWVTTAGTILDAAALSLSALDLPNDPHAALCIRSGYLCLRRIADLFGLDHNANPKATDPISITRDEFDDALKQLEAVGTPIKTDREQAWADFVGWRVNYDTVLLTLASLCMAPTAPWSSDRSIAYRRAPVVRFRRRGAI
jgi:hypothetical protein